MPKPKDVVSQAREDEEFARRGGGWDSNVSSSTFESDEPRSAPGASPDVNARLERERIAKRRASDEARRVMEEQARIRRRFSGKHAWTPTSITRDVPKTAEEAISRYNASRELARDRARGLDNPEPIDYDELMFVGPLPDDDVMQREEERARLEAQYGGHIPPELLRGQGPQPDAATEAKRAAGPGGRGIGFRPEGKTEDYYPRNFIEALKDDWASKREARKAELMQSGLTPAQIQTELDKFDEQTAKDIEKKEAEYQKWLASSRGMAAKELWSEQDYRDMTTQQRVDELGIAQRSYGLQNLSWDETTRMLDDEEERHRRVREQWQVEYEKRLTSMDSAVTELRSKKFEPWGGSSGRQMLAAIGAGLGAVGAAFTGGPNWGLEATKVAMEGQFKAWQAEVDAKGAALVSEGNILGRMMQYIGEEDAAHAATKRYVLERVEAKIEGIAAGTQRDLVRARAAAMLPTIKAMKDIENQKLEHAFKRAGHMAAIQMAQGLAAGVRGGQDGQGSDGWTVKDFANKKGGEDEFRRWADGYVEQAGVFVQPKDRDEYERRYRAVEEFRLANADLSSFLRSKGENWFQRMVKGGMTAPWKQDEQLKALAARYNQAYILMQRGGTGGMGNSAPEVMPDTTGFWKVFTGLSPDEIESEGQRIADQSYNNISMNVNGPRGKIDYQNMRVYLAPDTAPVQSNQFARGQQAASTYRGQPVGGIGFQPGGGGEQPVAVKPKPREVGSYSWSKR